MEAMELTLEQINYISEHVSTKLQLAQKQAETDLKFEKIIQQLEHQRELMEIKSEENNRRFDLMDKRFDQMDKRFEQVDKRFDRMYTFMRWQTGLGFAMAAGIYLKLFLG